MATFSIAATTPTATEGAPEPAGSLVFTVARTDGAAAADGARYTVFYNVGGTATLNADYVLPPGFVVFGPGETSRTISVATKADALAEGDETVVLTLVGVTSGGQLSGGPATGTIVDAAAGSAPAPALSFEVTRDGVSRQEAATVYGGPVSYLQFEFLGSAAGESVRGSPLNDFVNLLGGDDAADGGAGEDVLDGGTGSNFLTGGAGRDTFFLDGRGGTTTWATVTDWQAGEQLSVWGWRPGVSRASWVERDGAPGFQGATLHADLNGDGATDTSVTWSGLTRAGLPAATEQDGLLWFA